MALDASRGRPPMLVLYDANQEPRASLGLSEVGVPTLSMYDGKGKLVVTLVGASRGGALGLLCSQDQRGVVIAGKPEALGFAVLDARGRSRVIIGLDGKPYVVLLDDRSKATHHLGDVEETRLKSTLEKPEPAKPSAPPSASEGEKDAPSLR